MAIIETRDLTKYYGKARGITELNLKVEEGEFFGFIGPNGAGKSTLIRSLLGLIKPTSGEAKVMGKPLSLSREYLEEIGYLPSETTFYGDMKVSELISYSAKLRKKDCEKEAKALCERLELDTKKRIDQLSLGNRKKVGIVCAMQGNPQIYLMDEPTSGLDPLIQKEFFDLLHERQKEGATIFFSSHVLSEVQHNCTRAAIIREGKLVAEGSIQSLSGSNTKNITLHGINYIPDDISAKSVVKMQDGISFLYQGDIRQLLSKVSMLPITDMTINEPELEDVFMHYYEKGDE
ncbi:MAG: ABC transporter ATP-binding protein [Firmicutes bacterium]|jgi:ABC-2 type transport system ATP-binding protein|nr:ABC transporter ATP-binding protein [Bacillota bacterium]